MVRKVSNSRLKETAFSQYNLRDAYITNMTDYQRSIRDEALFSNWGMKVLVRIPATDEDANVLADNLVDEYSNFTAINWIDTTETIIPRFTEYRQALSEAGMQADGVDGLYPLECIIPSKLYLPRNARIVFPEMDNKEDCIAREWVVLGTIMKQLSGGKTYSRIANCVPARRSSFDTADLKGLHTIWFDPYIDEQGININKEIHAQGTIWFVNRPVNMNHSVRAIEATIFERLPVFPEIEEQIAEPFYYDTRPKHIISGGVGFEKGEEYDVYDENGNLVYVNTTEGGNPVQLILTVKEVNSIGAIEEFSLNVEKGFTGFGDEGYIQIELAKDESFPAIINLVSIIATGDNYEESLTAQIIEAPKYFTPYMMTVSLTAKNVTMEVVS